MKDNPPAFSSSVICNANRPSRIITFIVREGFGDGTDGNGLRLADPDTQERDLAILIFGQALDIITGKLKSEHTDERWVVLRSMLKYPGPEEPA